MALTPADEEVGGGSTGTARLSDAMVEHMARLSYAENAPSLISQVAQIHVMFTRRDSAEYPNTMAQVIAEGGFEPLSTADGQRRMANIPDDRLALLTQVIRSIEKDRTAIVDPSGGAHMFGNADIMRARGTGGSHDRAGYTVTIDKQSFYGGDKDSATEALPFLKAQLAALDVEPQYLEAAVKANASYSTRGVFDADQQKANRARLDLLDMLGMGSEENMFMAALFMLLVAWARAEEPEAFAALEAKWQEAGLDPFGVFSDGEADSRLAHNSYRGAAGRHRNGRTAARAKDIGVTSAEEAMKISEGLAFDDGGRYQLVTMQTGVLKTGAARARLVLLDDEGNAIFSADMASGGAGLGALPGLDDGSPGVIATTAYAIDWADVRINRSDPRGRAGMSYGSGGLGYSFSLINPDNMGAIGGAGRSEFRIHPVGRSVDRNLGCLEFRRDADARKFIKIMTTLSEAERPLALEIVDPRAGKAALSAAATALANAGVQAGDGDVVTSSGSAGADELSKLGVEGGDTVQSSAALDAAAQAFIAEQNSAKLAQGAGVMQVS